MNLNSESAELADLGNILDERLGWLQQNGYVDFIENNGTELGQQKAKLTKKGLMATECNEACLLILPEFYENLGIRRQDLIQNPNHLIVLLSAFLEPIQRDSSADTMHALACVRQSKTPQIIKSSAELLFSLANKVQDVEGVQ